jgi:Holliday junction resolvase RusA-like endonuclease
VVASTVTGITLVVPGKPRGKGRPKFARRGNHVATYTDDQTVSAEEAIRALWREQGSTRLDGPLELTVQIVHERPRSHFLKSGDLSTEGRRHPVPMRKPDGDNVLKLAADALNTLAYRDDCQIVQWSCRASWGIRPQTVISLRPLPTLPW